MTKLTVYLFEGGPITITAGSIRAINPHLGGTIQTDVVFQTSEPQGSIVVARRAFAAYQIANIEEPF